MITFEYCIQDPEGIHARPAGEIVKLAKDFVCKVELEAAGKIGDCKRIFGIMSLGIKQGQTVTITFDGEDEVMAYEVISRYIQNNL